MKRFFIVLKHDGKVSIHPMKKWLKQHPEYAPEGFDAATSTSHQLRNGLKKKGWNVKELSDRVFLIQPHIDASLLNFILKEKIHIEDYSEKLYIHNTEQSNVLDFSKYGFMEVGKWVLDQSLRFGIRFKLSSLEDKRVIYAFVVDDTVKYIGICDNFSTTLTLSKEKKILIGKIENNFLFYDTTRLSKSPELVSHFGFKRKSAPTTYRGSIAMGHETF